MLFEVAGEVKEAGVAEGEGDVGEGGVVASQNFLCLFDAEVAGVCHRGDAHGGGKQLAEIDGGQPRDTGESIICDIFAVVLGDVFNRGGDFLLLFGGKVARRLRTRQLQENRIHITDALKLCRRHFEVALVFHIPAHTQDFFAAFERNGNGATGGAFTVKLNDGEVPRLCTVPLIGAALGEDENVAMVCQKLSPAR